MWMERYRLVLIHEFNVGDNKWKRCEEPIAVDYVVSESVISASRIPRFTHMVINKAIDELRSYMLSKLEESSIFHET